MKLKPLILGCFAALIALSAPATAQNPTEQSKAVACPATDFSGTGYNNWFLGVHPSDDLITVWCRLQQLPGNVRFNIMFPTYKVHHSWNTSFEGAKLTPTHIVRLVQSLLPMVNTTAKDENGMEFHKVLQSVVQLQAKQTPSGRDLGFAPEHPSAKELVLWEPIVLRVRPVVLAGQEFTLSITLKPNMGILALALQGQATDLKFKGWKGRMDAGGMFGRGCSSAIPACEDLPESPSFHAPWVVTEMELTTQGNNLTNSAVAIMDRLGRSRFAEGGVKSFNSTNGQGNLKIDDKQTRMEMQAVGSPGGTKSITIRWDVLDQPDTYWGKLQEIGKRFKVGSVESENKPTAPDILNRL